VSAGADFSTVLKIQQKPTSVKGQIGVRVDLERSIATQVTNTASDRHLIASRGVRTIQIDSDPKRF
jgi:hypothetical protein